MSTELELKLVLPEEALRQAERLPWLRKLSAQSASHRDIASVYFDTKTLKLRRHGVTLRVRNDGSRYVQTIKGPSGASGALARAEREDPIPSKCPRLKHAKGTPLAALVTRKLKRNCGRSSGRTCGAQS